MDQAWGKPSIGFIVCAYCITGQTSIVISNILIMHHKVNGPDPRHIPSRLFLAVIVESMVPLSSKPVCSSELVIGAEHNHRHRNAAPVVLPSRS